MDALSKRLKVRLRPHIKTHKIPEIARRQVNLSNNGIAVSKLGEAEVMIDAGLNDILIANQIIGEKKIKRLNALSERADIIVCADTVTGVEQLRNCFSSSGKLLKVMIEINTGMNRCGVYKEKDVALLLDTIDKSGNLSFEGFLSHAGNIYGSESIEELKAIAAQEISLMNDISRQWADKGVDVNRVSIGSTPASLYWQQLGESSGGTAKPLGDITEIRPGNYVFYDNIQVSLGVTGIENCALTVLAAVISLQDKNRLIIDAGSKSLGLDRGAHSKQMTDGYGYIVDCPGAVIERLSEEHGIIRMPDNVRFNIGDKLTIIPNHSCSVTNLFNQAYVVEDEAVCDVWEIAGRGKVQ